MNELVYEVRFGEVNSFLNEYAENISKGGMFLKTSSPPQLDQKITLKIYLPKKTEALTLTATVVRRVSLSQAQRNVGSPGMGVRFEDFNESQEAVFFSYLKELN
jgi:type IV pilus assembly protein PilZ